MVEIGVGMMVHAGAQIDEPLGPLDQGVRLGRQRVDREHMGQAVSGDAMAFAIADGGVVDQSVETATHTWAATSQAPAIVSTSPTAIATAWGSYWRAASARLALRA